MSWRVLGTSDLGDSTHYGGFDLAKINQLLKAVANVDVVDFDSNIFFRDGRLKLKNGTSSITFRHNSILTNSDLIIPNPATGNVDTMLTTLSNLEIFNKTINARNNTLLGVSSLPSVRKQGTIPAGGVTGGGAGTGTLYGFIDMPGLPARGVDDTFGSYWRYNTGATANTPTGIRLPARWVKKEWALYFRAKTRVVTSTTNTRQYIGLSWQTQIPASDTPISNSESAVLVGWRSTDANIQVFTNAGTAASPTTPSVTNTNIAKNTSVRQYEIFFTNNPANGVFSARVRILDGSGTTQQYQNYFPTNLPNDAMSPSINFSSTGTAADYDLFLAEMEQDK